MKSDVFLALDLNSKEEAFRIAAKWAPYVKGFKVGPRLGFLMNPFEWKELGRLGEIFIDYKFFDIPSTVVSSVRASFELGVSYCTVHALNGGVCLRALAELEKELNYRREFKILCVTLLTSFDQEKNKLPLSRGRAAKSIVSELTLEVVEAGIKGLVCSPFEVGQIKESKPDLFCVTPGIRFNEDSNDDQSRVSSPFQAWSEGADALVMGRSLLRAGESEDVFLKTVGELERQWLSV